MCVFVCVHAYVATYVGLRQNSIYWYNLFDFSWWESNNTWLRYVTAGVVLSGAWKYIGRHYSWGNYEAIKTSLIQTAFSSNPSRQPRFILPNVTIMVTCGLIGQLGRNGVSVKRLHSNMSSQRFGHKQWDEFAKSTTKSEACVAKKYPCCTPN